MHPYAILVNVNISDVNIKANDIVVALITIRMYLVSNAKRVNLKMMEFTLIVFMNYLKDQLFI